MIKYALKKWDKNKDALRNAIQQTEKYKRCFWDYNDIVKLVCRYIFNENVSDEDPMINVDGITMIDNGDYQGTLIFMLPFDTDQPAEYEYLMTYVGYGSCSGCDTLQCIQSDDEDDETEKEMVDSYLGICKDIVSNTIRPYNQGWRNNGMFDSVDSLSSRDSIREIKIITKKDLYDIIFEWIKPKLDKCLASGGRCLSGSDARGFYLYLNTGVGRRHRQIGAQSVLYGDGHLGYEIWSWRGDNVNIRIRKDSIEFIENSKFEDFSKEDMKELYYKITNHMFNCGVLNEEDIK